MWIDYQRSFFRLSQLQIIALTAYLEARAEGRRGMTAVINVIHNRRLHPIRRFGDSDILGETKSPYHSVCLKKWQFSCYNLGDPNRGIGLRLSNPTTFTAELPNNLSLRTAMEICDVLRRGALVDITGGADHYWSIHIPNPSWSTGMLYRTTIGNHEFWSEPPHYFESPQRYHPEMAWVVPAPIPPRELLTIGVGGLIITGT